MNSKRNRGCHRYCAFFNLKVLVESIEMNENGGMETKFRVSKIMIAGPVSGTYLYVPLYRSLCNLLVLYY